MAGRYEDSGLIDKSRCSSARNKLKSGAVTGDVDRRARCEPKGIPQRLRNNNPSNGIDRGLHWENVTRHLPARRSNKRAGGNDHDPCRSVLSRADLRLIVPALAVAEATYLVGRLLGTPAEAAFLRGLGALDVEGHPLTSTGVAQLVETYADFPLGGTDASVIALAERVGEHRRLTRPPPLRRGQANPPRRVPAAPIAARAQCPQHRSRDAQLDGLPTAL